MRFLMVLVLGLTLGCDDNRYASSQRVDQTDAGAEDAKLTPDALPTDVRATDVPQEEVTLTPDGDDFPDLSDVPPDVRDVTMDTPDDVPPDPDAGPVECVGLGEYSCIDTVGCILDLAPTRGTYVCRPAHNECEWHNRGACGDADGCWWDFGECYCGPDEDCDCGGGPAAQCRPVTDLRPCHATTAAYCFPGETCCPTGPGDLGQCTPHGLCDGGDCGTLVSFHLEGGLCEFGPCRFDFKVLDGGHVTAESDNYEVGPRDGRLDPELYAEVVALLADLDVDSLEDGYGECCEADSDGSDVYVTFYNHGPPTRTVRVSDRQRPPAALRRLVELGERGRALVLAPRAGGSPALTWPSRPLRPPVSCHTPFETNTGHVSWFLEGPNGERFGPDQFQWMGPRPDFPFLVTVHGQATWIDQRSVEIEGEDGLWRLTFLAMPAGLRLPKFGPGPLTVQVNLDQAFVGTLAGLVVRNDRGILLATDEGLSNLHASGAVPWRVELLRNRCSPQQDADGHHVPLQFRTDSDEFVLFGGQWARMQLPDGYDLLVHATRAFESGHDDDGWNYGYVAVAMPATDLCE